VAAASAWGAQALAQRRPHAWAFRAPARAAA
jgi:hypothetical protein